MYELCNGKKPNIGYFHHFGCKCFIHNNGKDNLGKFDPHSDEGIFLDYSSISRSYIIFYKRIFAIEESIHIIFDDFNRFTKNKNSLDDEEYQNFQSVVISSKEVESLDQSTVIGEHQLTI